MIQESKMNSFIKNTLKKKTQNSFVPIINFVKQPILKISNTYI